MYYCLYVHIMLGQYDYCCMYYCLDAKLPVSMMPVCVMPVYITACMYYHLYVILPVCNTASMYYCLYVYCLYVFVAEFP
jgi:hypothetical protein